MRVAIDTHGIESIIHAATGLPTPRLACEISSHVIPDVERTGKSDGQQPGTLTSAKLWSPSRQNEETRAGNQDGSCGGLLQTLPRPLTSAGAYQNSPGRGSLQPLNCPLGTYLATTNRHCGPSTSWTASPLRAHASSARTKNELKNSSPSPLHPALLRITLLETLLPSFTSRAEPVLHPLCPLTPLEAHPCSPSRLSEQQHICERTIRRAPPR